METTAITKTERRAARNRIFKDASTRLGESLDAFALGCGATYGLSCLEGWIHLERKNRPSSLRLERSKFVLRYGLANMIPSVVWGRIEAKTIVASLGLSPRLLRKEMPPWLLWRRTRLQALRGAIAGTVIVSQLVGLAKVWTQAEYAYFQRLADGREPPLEDPSRSEVVIRLAGRISDVTMLGMQREGKRKYFPVFESSDITQTQQLVRKYAIGTNCSVPVFWHVEDGQYSYEDSWKGMNIPRQWLFKKENKRSPTTDENILILEADATSGENMSLSLTHPKKTSELDLDLYEVAQGFYRLQRLVADDAPSHDVLRVLLVDADGIVQRGGGRICTVRNYVTKLGLSDIIIDAHGTLLHSVHTWLAQRTWNEHHLLRSGLFPWNKSYTRKPVILETPNATCFYSIKSALDDLDYDVMDMSDAVKEYGSIDELPVLVYENTSQDTIHTIRRLLDQKLVLASNICALCPTHHGLVELRPGQASPIATICSSDIYDNIFRYVRRLATDGYSKQEIQEQLDNHLDIVLDSPNVPEGRRLGFPPLDL
jgi:hypothetical protein